MKGPRVCGSILVGLSVALVVHVHRSSIDKLRLCEQLPYCNKYPYSKIYCIIHVQLSKKECLHGIV